MVVGQTRRLVAAALIAAITVAPAAVARAQAPVGAPRFEVATIRPTPRDAPPMSLQRQPNGRIVTANTPLTFLIAWAFEVDESRLVNVPSGAASARFDIVAAPPVANPGPGQLQRMMQALLADRFRLAAHRETREGTAYALVADERGVKIQARPPDGPPGASPFDMRARGTLTGTRVTTDMLAKVLSNQLGRPVENRAGIQGMFDFTLNWRPDDRVDDDRPALFDALREQLGLRLIASRAPLDVIVIDRLELTPTGN